MRLFRIDKLRKQTRVVLIYGKVQASSPDYHKDDTTFTSPSVKRSRTGNDVNTVRT